MLNVFGPNISTVSEEDWPRHKKATGPPFSNEQTNNLIWQEALRQSQEMMQCWIDQGEWALRTTAEDAKTFSLNILTNAGFGKRSKTNLMTSLIRASKSSSEFKTGDMDPRSKQSGLSESEIFGNMFVFNFAGHDTISHTLCYALNPLAAHPTVQDWISEEVNAVFLDSDSSTWDYARSFPKLKRCMAIMVCKYSIDVVGELRDEIWTPSKASYMPWSEGPRGCPGKKIGQVEFVAAMAGLFHKHRVEVVKEIGENQREAEKRVKTLVDDSAMVLLLQMMNPEKAGLRWVKKG
ncbi:hypothetical protein BOTNAR_0235g00170 [Botryotinia narcissicola]|uniref:Cytochrome P450 n=1 Tax=Botryotinia narcissicola TaxID=278944 RepID=A0A4Z1I3L9_9HELO|nr:hypothetical protein BOTNAR_0235g00170 [Botryotinia narcissicola]